MCISLDLAIFRGGPFSSGNCYRLSMDIFLHPVIFTASAGDLPLIHDLKAVGLLFTIRLYPSLMSSFLLGAMSRSCPPLYPPLGGAIALLFHVHAFFWPVCLSCIVLLCIVVCIVCMVRSCFCLVLMSVAGILVWLWF